MEAGKSKVKTLAELVSGEGPLPGSQVTVFLEGPLMAKGTREHSEVPFIGTVIPFMRTPSS